MNSSRDGLPEHSAEDMYNDEYDEIERYLDWEDDYEDKLDVLIDNEEWWGDVEDYL